MSIRNLPVDFLYRKLPAGVVKEDVRGILSAFVNGYQDRIDELRTLTDQISQLWVPDNTVGEPCQVVQADYQPDDLPKRTITLTVLDDTPVREPAALISWVAAEAGVRVDQLSNVRLSTDLYRTAEQRTLQLLAETLGAKLYTPLGADEAETVAAQKRALQSYFARLKLKGTSRSFELLGALHGFTDVAFTPLWSRVSTRNPSQVGAELNDSDFAAQPEVPPTPGVESSFYSISDLADGPIFSWASAAAAVDSSLSNYLPLAVNGQNPFIEVRVVATPVRIPVAGTYFLGGGSAAAKAKVSGLLDANGLDCNLEFWAIADGESFNGLQISIVDGPDGPAEIVLHIVHNLSAIKFRSSYFDVSVGAQMDSYLESFGIPARPSDYLQALPTAWEWHDTAVPGSFANGGVAVEPWRPWGGGSVPMPTVSTWPTLSKTPGVGSLTPKVQVAVDTQSVDVAPLDESGNRLVGNLDDVRPATRLLRTFKSGFSVEDEVGYAAYASRAILISGTAEFESGTVANSGAVPTYLSRSSITAGTDYPEGPAKIQFVWRQDGQDHQITGEFDLDDSNVINLIYNSDQVSLTGWFDLSDASYQFIIASDLVVFSIEAIWTSTTSEQLQTEPSTELKDGGNAAYRDRPEDSIDLTSYTDAVGDEVASLRSALAGGETVDADLYHADGEDLSAARIGREMILLDEVGQPWSALALDAGVTGRPRLGFTTDAVGNGQRAVAFGSIPALVQQDEVLDAVTNPDLSQRDIFGIPFEAGLVRGLLVADPAAHWTPSVASGLALWLHFGEHPQDRYGLRDCSDLALTQSELELGAFSANYNLEDRVWDTTRGWVLDLGPNSHVSLTKDRSLVDQCTASGWLKVGSYGAETSRLLQYGPVLLELKANGDLVLKIESVDGDIAQLGLAPTIGTAWKYWSFAVKPVDIVQRIKVVAVLEDNSTLSGLVVGDLNLAVGDPVLVVGQTDPADNGLYLALSGAWERDETTADIWADAGVFFDAPNGALWRLTTSAGFTIGVDDLEFELVNCQWTFTVATSGTVISYQASGLASMREFNTDDSEYRIESGLHQVKLSDWRVWRSFKTSEEFQLLCSPNVKRSGVAYWPTTLISASGKRFTLETVPAGYAFPSLKPANVSFDPLTRLARYRGDLIYVGPIDQQAYGFGDQLVAEVDGLLGATGTGWSAKGLGPVSGKHGAMTESTAWRARNPEGQYEFLEGWPGSLTLDYESTEAGSTPDSQDGENWDELRIFVLGDDNRTYAVTLKATRSGLSLVAQAMLRYRSASVDGTAPEVWESPGSPTCLVSTEDVGTLSVTLVDGEPQVVAIAGADATTPPKYLSALVEEQLNLVLNNGIAAWLNPTELGTELQLVVRETAGLITLDGSGFSLAAGKYEVELDVSNLGPLDDSFAGFGVEVAIGSDLVSLATIRADGFGQYILTTNSGQSRSLNVPDYATPAELQSALASLADETGGLTVLTSGSWVSLTGGPYYVQFDDTGVQLLLEAQLATAGLAVDITKVVVGEVGVKEIQKITVQRPKAIIPVTVSVDSSSGWNLQIYWNNPRSSSSGTRRLVVFNAAVRLIKTRMASVSIVDVDGDPAIDLDEQNLDGNPDTAGGAWRAEVQPDGDVEHTAAGRLYPDGEDSGDIPSDSSLPLSAVLTGSSNRRLDMVLSDQIVTADPAEPPASPVALPEVEVDGDPVTINPEAVLSLTMSLDADIST